jgi:hypothetical protein
VDKGFFFKIIIIKKIFGGAVAPSMANVAPPLVRPSNDKKLIMELGLIMRGKPDVIFFNT